MDGTSIDKLYLDIGVNSKGTTRTINAITKSIEKLTSSISAFDAKNVYKKFDSLFRIFNNADVSGAEGVKKSLSGIATSFKKIVNIDVKNLYGKFNSLTRIITPFVDKVKEGETSLVALAQTLKSVKTPTSTGGGKTSNGGTNKTSKNLNIFATLGKWNYMINMARYYGRSLANIVQLSMDYVETQNLWQVANRNNLEMAEQFIQKMNKAYGVSEATLMNYQAIFKNMLSALGDLSDEISSGLSMQLTQMALDFSSLYNVTIPSAMQKFQAVLSGQVRPIRSVSGYDITENTIFDLYAGAGGEKTMRQLSQIEKRLLRIVAVFDQMGATGATGDMAKTIESASNQARIMNEQFQETMTWTGQTILMWMDSIGVFKYINALLITMKNIMKAIAIDLGYEDKNFLDDMVFSAEEAGEAVDEIQGKLLSFDKFEALNSKDSNILGIDQTVLDLLEKVKYETQDFQMEAQKLAKSWTSWWVDADTGGLTDKAKELLDVMKSIGIVLGTLIGYKLITKIGSLTGKITGLTTATSLLSFALATGAVYAIIKAVEAFKEGDTWGGILATTIGVGLVTALALLNKEFIKTTATKIISFFQNIQLQGALATTTIQKLQVGMSYLGVAVGTAIGSFAIFDSILGSLDGTAKKVVSIISIVIGTLGTLLGLILAIKGGLKGGLLGATIAGLGVGALIAGIKNTAQAYSAPAYATGGFPEDGLFFANSGEMVGQFSNGKTAVANNDQIVTGITQGVYSAMMAYNAQTRGQGGAGDVYLDGTKVGRVVAKGSHSEMVRVGLIKANS